MVKEKKKKKENERVHPTPYSMHTSHATATRRTYQRCVADARVDIVRRQGRLEARGLGSVLGLRHCQQRGHANGVQHVGVLPSLPPARQHVSTVDGSSSRSSRQRFPPSPSGGGLGRQNKWRGGWRFARRKPRGCEAEGACRSHRGRAGHRNAARRGGRGQGA